MEFNKESCVVYGMSGALQRYFWFKKKNAVWTTEHPFPRDVEYLMCDTLEQLRPKLKISTSWDEASQAADALDKEFASKLGELGLVEFRRVEVLMELHLRATGCHFRTGSYGIC